MTAPAVPATGLRPLRRGAPVTLRPSRTPIKIDPVRAAAVVPSADPGEEAAATELVPPAPASRSRAVARPVPQLPVSETALLNNLLVREITDPSDNPEPEDASLRVMQAVVRAALTGQDLGDVEAQIKQLSSMIEDKHELLNAIINGPHALHEKHEWLTVRNKVDRELRNLARRGDLTTAELLVVASLANDRVKEIDKEIKGAPPADPITVVHRIENNRKREDVKMAQLIEGTTPQGREIVRKQVYGIRKQLRKRADPAPSESGS